jgi:hypothetical protein
MATTCANRWKHVVDVHVIRLVAVRSGSKCGRCGSTAVALFQGPTPIARRTTERSV